MTVVKKSMHLIEFSLQEYILPILRQFIVFLYDNLLFMIYNPKHVKDTYDKIADDEDQKEKTQNLRTKIPREFIKKYIKKTDIVLDAGGGTGINAIMMAKKCKHVSLVDISTEIIHRAKTNVKEAKLFKKVSIIE